MTAQPEPRLRERRLTPQMAEMLWTIAQHKYGWCHVQRYGGQYQIAEALARRGLVRFVRDHNWAAEATPEGREAIRERFPVSPFILETYEHQPGGWTPLEAANV